MHVFIRIFLAFVVSKYHIAMATVLYTRTWYITEYKKIIYYTLPLITIPTIWPSFLKIDWAGLLAGQQARQARAKKKKYVESLEVRLTLDTRDFPCPFKK